jgi:hypothetical protein
MESVLKPTGKLIGAAVAVLIGAIVLYLGALFHVYLIAWVVQFLNWLF